MIHPMLFPWVMHGKRLAKVSSVSFLNQHTGLIRAGNNLWNIDGVTSNN